MASREHEYEDQLLKEGFKQVYVWQDGPDTWYPDHRHPTVSTHIILEGEMTLTLNGEARTYGVGERCDVPGRTVHSARMGPQGCRYLIGEK